MEGREGGIEREMTSCFCWLVPVEGRRSANLQKVLDLKSVAITLVFGSYVNAMHQSLSAAAGA